MENLEAAMFSERLRAKISQSIHRASCDFRSDTVTAPDEAMMQAILGASTMDDVYDLGEDASTNALEEAMIDLTGKEAALWAPSGTQANQICLRTHLTSPPHAVLVDYRAHVHCSEVGALPVLSQASVTMVVPSNGLYLRLEDIKDKIIPSGNIHHTPTRVVSLENTLSGVILPLKEVQAISKYVRQAYVPTGQRSVAMHLDGARVLDGVVGEGVDLREYAACFDTMSICLSKGIGAPMGSMIVGDAEFVQRARVIRKMLGGGTRQPGMMAAAALSALQTTLPRIRDVHEFTRTTWESLRAMGYETKLPVQTNMIILDLARAGVTPAAFVSYCNKEGLLVFPSGRLVFHHQTSSEGITKLLVVMSTLIRDAIAGKLLGPRKPVHEIGC